MNILALIQSPGSSAKPNGNSLLNGGSTGSGFESLLTGMFGQPASNLATQAGSIGITSSNIVNAANAAVNGAAGAAQSATDAFPGATVANQSLMQAASGAAAAAGGEVPVDELAAKATGTNLVGDAAKAVTNAATAAAAAKSAANTVAGAAAKTAAEVKPGVVTNAIADGATKIAPAGEASAKAKPVSLITGSGETVTAQATIKATVMKVPGTDAARETTATGAKKVKAAPAAANPTGPAPQQIDQAALNQARAAAAEAASGPKGGANNTSPTGGEAKGGTSFTLTTAGGDASLLGTTALPGTLGAEATSQAATARGGITPQVPVSEQVAIQFSRALADGADQITIRLQPEALGRVDVKVEMGSDGRIMAAFVAERPETLEMLQRDARILERALNDAGLKTDGGGLSFNLRGDGQELPQFGQENSGGASGDAGSGDETILAGDDETAGGTKTALSGNGLLDIQV